MESTQIVILVFTGVLSLIIGFFIGKVLTSWASKKWHREEREKMFTIEQALKEFWDHERVKFEKKIEKLKATIDQQEKQIEKYRKKVSGVGLMGMGQDQKSEMLMSLLMENEALEEKLFEQNRKLHKEREEYLEREMEHVSYKKVLLSHILNNPDIRNKIQNYLAESKEIETISLEASTSASSPETSEEEEAPATEKESKSNSGEV